MAAPGPKPARSATMALIYITLGALMVVWTVIYYIYLNRYGASEESFLWCYGFFFSGLVLMVIGFGVGRIGRSAKQAEVAPIVNPPALAGGPPAPPAPQQAPVHRPR